MARKSISIPVDSTEDFKALDEAYELMKHLEESGKKNVEVLNNTGYTMTIEYDDEDDQLVMKFT